VARLFHRSRGHVVASFSADDVELLRNVLTQMQELLSSGAGDVEDDPLAAAVGIGTATSAPDDPALARRFPDGYRDDDEAAADFRRYTEPGLRAAKLAAIETALGTLDAPDAKRRLTKAECLAWLRALTDVRLVLGERLAITEDWEQQVAGLEPDDPALGSYLLYDNLTLMQGLLVDALD